MSKTKPTAPRPTIQAARQAVIDEVIRESIALYHQAHRAMARMNEARADDRALDGVDQVVTHRFITAEGLLVDAIVAAYPPLEDGLYPSRAVRCDGRLYVVRPDTDDAFVNGQGADDGMHLTVIDEPHVADAGTTADLPVYQPDWTGVEHLEDPDAVAPRRKGRRRGVSPTATPPA